MSTSDRGAASLDGCPRIGVAGRRDVDAVAEQHATTVVLSTLGSWHALFTLIVVSNVTDRVTSGGRGEDWALDPVTFRDTRCTVDVTNG